MRSGYISPKDCRDQCTRRMQQAFLPYSGSVHLFGLHRKQIELGK